jgi:hypothetical protein
MVSAASRPDIAAQAAAESARLATRTPSNAPNWRIWPSATANRPSDRRAPSRRSGTSSVPAGLTFRSALRASVGWRVDLPGEEVTVSCRAPGCHQRAAVWGRAWLCQRAAAGVMRMRSGVHRPRFSGGRSTAQDVTTMITLRSARKVTMSPGRDSRGADHERAVRVRGRSSRTASPGRAPPAGTVPLTAAGSRLSRQFGCPGSPRAAYMADLCFEVASADDLLARTNREPGIDGRTSGWCS